MGFYLWAGVESWSCLKPSGVCCEFGGDTKWTWQPCTLIGETIHLTMMILKTNPSRFNFEKPCRLYERTTDRREVRDGNIRTRVDPKLAE